ncbi:hypothetical protein ACO0LO_23930 [Undibacterium sp. TJN25]|uniref:hypothetical protein n=1 Tax=Undibacterium sp. TJN25 TaxID=3413056 RepID=UPI003BF00FCD
MHLSHFTVFDGAMLICICRFFALFSIFLYAFFVHCGPALSIWAEHKLSEKVHRFQANLHGIALMWRTGSPKNVDTPFIPPARHSFTDGTAFASIGTQGHAWPTNFYAGLTADLFGQRRPLNRLMKSGSEGAVLFLQPRNDAQRNNGS